ncbi:MAG: hypothetical protein U0792_11810 [Gemmataceae bacterium]
MDLRPLIFVPALLGCVVFGFIFLAYLCHAYLTVLEGTAAGAKQMSWEGFNIIDNFGRFFYMAWLVGLWLGPAYFIGRAATAGTDSAWLKLLTPLFVLWICFPVSQMSSLSASTMWLPLTPDVFARLVQKPAVVLQFFGLTAVVMLVFGLGFQWTFLTEDDWPLLFVGSPVVVLSVLLYARLLGRLAFMLRFTQDLLSKKRKKKKSEVSEADATEEESQPKPKRAQPRELPPLETPEGELAGYDVRFEDDTAAPKKRVVAEAAETDEDAEPDVEVIEEEAEPRRPRRRPAPENAVERGRMWTDEDDEETTAYGVHEPVVKSDDQPSEEVAKPRAEEERLVKRSDRPKKPKRVWSQDLWLFLGQPRTIGVLVVATGMCAAFGMMVRIARQFNPAAGGTGE